MTPEETVDKLQEEAGVLLKWIKEQRARGIMLISICELSPGELGRVISPGDHQGKVLLRVMNGAVQFDGIAGKGIDTWAYAGGPEAHFNGPYVERLTEPVYLCIKVKPTHTIVEPIVEPLLNPVL